MTDTVRQRVILAAILSVTAIALYYLWRTFWFLTDDAFIAFRYISNSIEGYGYVWNPAPFRPVEGYTSFLWVALLDLIWRITGVTPPDSANWISFLFSFSSLVIVALWIKRMQLGANLSRYRYLLLAIAIIGILANTTFLVWSSSGLETAMFNFWVLLWVFWIFQMNESSTSAIATAGAASMIYLSRPDGLLFVAATLLILQLSLPRGTTSKLKMRLGFVIAPLVIPLIHLLWRHSFYGEWLPNTFYAKVSHLWPGAGWRYLLSFILEYGLWMWLLIILVALWKSRSSNRSEGVPFLSRFTGSNIAIVTILLHLSYYIIVVGGDHFEYRVLSYTVPLIYISLLWAINRLQIRFSHALILGTLVIFLSIPMSWSVWSLSKEMKTRAETHVLRVKVADSLPPWIGWYSSPFDALQDWLISHHVCMRWQEHKAFYEYLKDFYPDRAFHAKEVLGSFPIFVRTSVGVPSWVLPDVNIIDGYGLNDYVIARNPNKPGTDRLMAHERSAPIGYYASFDPNVINAGRRDIRVGLRVPPFTPDKIRAIEDYWRAVIVEHDSTAVPPFDPALLEVPASEQPAE